MIAWHVDDHVEYDKVGEMTGRRGNKLDYLGMTLNFSEDGKFNFDMEEYLAKTLSRLSEDTSGVATTPTADHTFKKCDSATRLNKERSELFHCVIPQTLFVAQNGRSNLRTAISFLTK